MSCTRLIRRIGCGLSLLVWLVTPAAVGGQQPVGESAFPEFTPLIQAKVDELELPGAAFLVVKDGEVLYSNTFGSFTMDTVFPIMSASKWITVGVIMSLVDEGLLALDDPVSKYLPEFRDGKKAEITIRQCLACTSGITWRVMAIYRTDMDFAEAVREVAKEPLEADPGSELIYGGTGFHVAGRVAEVASGKGWHQLFEERIAKPLGMTDSVYGTRDPANRQNLLPIPASNPWLGGGLITSMNGYATFVQMLLDEGMYRERRVLSAESVRQMRIDQSRDAAITRTLHPVGETHYTLGAWVERVAPDGEARQIRDMGAWGFNPWVDYERGYFAIFGTQDQLQRVWGLTKQLEEIIQQNLDGDSQAAAAAAGSSEPVTRTVELSVNGISRSALLYVPADLPANRPLPLVIALHPGGAEGHHAMEQGGWDQKAEQEEFLVVFPQAVAYEIERDGEMRSFPMWNDGSGRRNLEIDDVAFLQALIDVLGERYPVDPSRVFLTGFGAGASMTFRAGHELSDRIAAIAPVSGHLWAETPTLERPVSLVAFLGTEDPVNPIKEGVTRATSYLNTPKPQVRDSVRRWARALGLPADSELKYVSEDVFRERWGPGENGAEAVFYIVEGLGHQWPGGTRISPNERLGPTSSALHATAVMWQFFVSHPGGGS